MRGNSSGSGSRHRDVRMYRVHGRWDYRRRRGRRRKRRKIGRSKASYMNVRLGYSDVMRGGMLALYDRKGITSYISERRSFISLLSTFIRFANLPPFFFSSRKKILRKLHATLLVVRFYPKANTSVFETHLIAYNEPGMRLGWSGSWIRTRWISIFIGHSREPVISTIYEYRDAIVKRIVDKIARNVKNSRHLKLRISGGFILLHISYSFNFFLEKGKSICNWLDIFLTGRI